MPADGDEKRATVTVAVCVATLRRPEGLRALLEGLAAQRTPGGCRWHVVVADNDPAGSAGPVLEEARGRLGIEIISVVEPLRGVAHARNATVRAAPGVDWLAFVDDDEVPAPDWLSTLLEVQTRTNADVVCGPVVPSFPNVRRAWFGELAALAPRPVPTGTRLPTAATGNVLVDRALLGSSPFDAEHFRTDAEDTDCFVDLERDGARIVWAADAVVTHTFGPERQTVRWIAGRAYRHGRAWTRVERRHHHGAWIRARRALAGVAHLGCGLTGAVWGAGRARPARAVDGVVRLSLGAGQLAGWLGRRPPPRRDQREVTMRT